MAKYKAIEDAAKEANDQLKILKDSLMAKYDQGGGCSCGLYETCMCDSTVTASNEKNHVKIDDLETSIIEFISKKYNLILVPKKDIEQLIKTLQRLL